MRATKRALIGHTIVGVDFGPFPDGRGGTAQQPHLTLDNGRQVWFTTEETDTGEYGTRIIITPFPKAGAF